MMPSCFTIPSHPACVTVPLTLLVSACAWGCARGSEAERSEAQRENAWVTPAASARGPFDARAESNLIAEVAGRALPAVVSVASTRVARVETPELPFDDPFFRRFFGPEGPLPFPMPPGREPEQQGLGSGVIVNGNLILTNAHVVEGASRLEITAQDKRKLNAELVGSDPKSDLAVLRITGDTGGLTSLEFADSSRVRLGEIVLAIGNPFGVGQTVTMGIVSAKGRANLGIVDYEDFIQTDAAINPGNSGGPLLDLQGRVIGINRAIRTNSFGAIGTPTNSGVGFAVPVNIVRRVVPSLIEYGKYDYPYLGISSHPEISLIEQEALRLPQANGAYIVEVVPGGPADQAGLRGGRTSSPIPGLPAGGDLIIAVDGRPVQVFAEMLAYLMENKSPGETIVLTIIRDNEQKEVTVTLGRRP